MASVKRRPDGKWRARYRDLEGKEHARHFDRKVDAERWLDGVRGELAMGTYVDPNAGRQTFGSYVEEWRAVQVHRDTTAAQVESHLRNHVLPSLGHRPIAAVRPTEVQAFVRGLVEKGLAPSTIEVIYRYVATVFRCAVEDQVIKSTPCRNVKLPKQERKRVVPLEVEVVEQLVDSVPERMRALLVLAAGTGLRQGEAFGLTLDRVDFLRRTVKVDQQLVLLAGAPPRLAPPKTAASYRTVPLPDVVLDELARHLARFPVGESGLVFTNNAGAPLRRNRFSEGVWQPAVRATDAPTGTHFHDLRHFYASLLIRHGESVVVVQSRLGHASATETLDTYSHLWPDSEDRTRTAVDLVLGNLADQPRTASAVQE